VATFKVKWDAMPAVKLSDVKSAVGKYKLDKTQLKVTGKAVEKNKKWILGNYLLSGDTEKLSELKGKALVVVGTLAEGEKAVPTIEVTSVEEVSKK
jgi:hypothetical protein